MAILAPLWLPILVSALAVFVVSAIGWMALGHHNADIKKLPDEGAFLDFMRSQNVPPGTYMWPGCGSGDMKNPEFLARFEAGPWGSVNVTARKPSFARNLALTFLFYIVVGIFVGYITSLARDPGAPFLSVFRVAGAVGVLAYCAGGIPNALFFGKPLRFILTDLIDGIVYGVITGLIFAWFWPLPTG